MIKHLYRFLFWLLTSALGIVAINSVYPVFVISSLTYYVLFVISVALVLGFISPFLLEFLTLRKHIYNLILSSTLLFWLTVWLFNDFLPHFRLIEAVFYKPVLFGGILSGIAQGLYKIAKNI